MNGKEKEIYDILYKKKEINDKTPKLRTEDEKKKLKNLSYKIDTLTSSCHLLFSSLEFYH